MKKSLLVRIVLISLVMAAVLTGNVFAEQTNEEQILELKNDSVVETINFEVVEQIL